MEMGFITSAIGLLFILAAIEAALTGAPWWYAPVFLLAGISFAAHGLKSIILFFHRLLSGPSGS
jgi:hypothetical protein